MKIEFAKPEDFEPIRLTLTIESKEELLDLASRLNAPAKAINESSDRYISGASMDGFALWEALDQIAVSRNLATRP